MALKKNFKRNIEFQSSKKDLTDIPVGNDNADVDIWIRATLDFQSDNEGQPHEERFADIVYQGSYPS